MALTLASCAGGAGGGGDDDTGRLVIGDGRAVAGSENDLSNLVLKGRRNGGSEQTLMKWDNVASMNGSIVELEAGSWVFTVEGTFVSSVAARSVKYLYGGTKGASIQAGKDTTVSLVLTNRGMPLEEALVGDYILSNGYACISGDEDSVAKSGASVDGIIVNKSGGKTTAMMKLTGGAGGYRIGGAGSTWGGLNAAVEDAGYRLPDASSAELDGALTQLTVLNSRPAEGHMITRTLNNNGNHQAFHLGSPSGYMGVSESYSATLYAVALKDF